MTVKLIGFTGFKGSGKNFYSDKMGERILTQYSVLNDVREFGFADELKKMVNSLFGWDDRHSYGQLKEQIDPVWGFSPRDAYQKFGTEFARSLNENFWINRIWSQIQPLEEREEDVLVSITDVRFENEYEWIRKHGGVMVCIDNHHVAPKEVKNSNNETILVYEDGTEVHESERYIPFLREKSDLVIENHVGKDMNMDTSELEENINLITETVLGV